MLFFYIVVLLSLSQAHVKATETAELKDEEAFDQIATASENVPQSKILRDKKRGEFRDQLISTVIDTVHYENSNGFVPMLASPRTQSPEPSAKANKTSTRNSLERANSTTRMTIRVLEIEKRDPGEIENDPAYSTEARMFLNLPQPGADRRSFNFQESQNEFELLKVRNDTPVIANYQDFYENVQNAMSEEDEQESSSHTAKRNKDRGKRIESYVAYGTAQNSGDSRGLYHSHDPTKDKKKAIYQSEKVAGNYHQQGSANYDGHGQRVGGQNEATGPSLPRTNQQVNEPAISTGKSTGDGIFDNVAQASTVPKPQHRFSRPVVVADPANYKTDAKFGGQSPIAADPNSNNYQTSRIIESTSSETSGRYSIYNRDGRFHGYEQNGDSRDLSDDNLDYGDYPERPRRVQKGRRRPYSESSQRLPKEHRASSEESSEFEEQARRQNFRSKPGRHRGKSNSWFGEDRTRGRDESLEQTRYDGRLAGSETKAYKTSRYKSSNTWNQISPNIEISHSSGVEIDQLQKPKLIVPVKVNLVPLTNFDHATALGNSQGFDVSNAVLRNLVTASPIGALTTNAHVLSTPEIITDNLGLQSISKNLGNAPSLEVSTSVPEIIIGQSNFQNQGQTVLLPQGNGQGKYSNGRAQYMSSTVSPVFAVTPSPSLQSVSIHNLQSAVTPRPTYTATPSPATNVHQVAASQMPSNVPHLLLPQPTLQTFSNMLQTPVQTNSAYNIQVNPHGLHGQNLVNHGNLQVHSIPIMTTVTPSPQVVPVTKVSLLKTDLSSKKAPPSTNFLASANLVVGQNEQKQPGNENAYYSQYHNTELLKTQPQDGLYQVLKNFTPKTKAYIQTTHIVPALLHPVPTLGTVHTSAQQLIPEQNIQNILVQRGRDPNQQLLSAHGNNGDSAMQQLQLQLQREQLLKNAKLPGFTYQSGDNVGSQSTNNLNTANTYTSVVGNAHLPNVGTKNVEILNPNMKVNPIDAAMVNTYGTMHYPAAVLTTPIPMFSSAGFVTARPAVVSTTTAESVNLQTFVDSLSELGAKTNQASATDSKADPNQERPMFNPINFIPNMEVVRNQNALNSKLHVSEPLQQNLNLVPLIPGGNFFKPAFAGQSELAMKPKLTSDLEKYAEQMFKESLKTIYNSHKWNNDRRRHNISEVDLMKLKNELQKLRASLTDAKHSNKDHFSGLASETKIRTTELQKGSPKDQQKNEQLLAALEQMLKSHPTGPTRPEGKRPGRGQRPAEHAKHGPGPRGNIRDMKHLRDFLTPPKANSHRSKNPFNEKPSKKRPGTGPPRFNGPNHRHGPRSRPKGSALKPSGLETAASNVDVGIHGQAFEREPDYGTGSLPFELYPSFTTASSESLSFNGHLAKNHKLSNLKDIDINHPRMHNLLGLLMKNKQLPQGNAPNFFRDKDQLKQFLEDEKRRLQLQFYGDTLREYLVNSSEAGLHNGAMLNLTGGRRAFAEKSAA